MNKSVNEFKHGFKHDFILLLIIFFINYNIVNILGKLLLPENYYINGQLKPNIQINLVVYCFHHMWVLNIILKRL
jgi:hypothetical protein